MPPCSPTCLLAGCWGALYCGVPSSAPPGRNFEMPLPCPADSPHLDGEDAVAGVGTSGGSHAARPVAMPELQARRYFSGLVKGLEYLHDRGVVHRDIKPDNLLVNDVDRCLIADFGCSRWVPRRTPGTARWLLCGGGGGRGAQGCMGEGGGGGGWAGGQGRADSPLWLGGGYVDGVFFCPPPPLPPLAPLSRAVHLSLLPSWVTRGP